MRPRRSRPPVSIACQAKSAIAAIAAQDSQRLLGAGDAVADEPPRRFRQCVAVGEGEPRDGILVAIVVDHRTDAIVDPDQLEQPDPPAIAALTAGIAAARRPDHLVL